MANSILLVDDDADVRVSLGEALTSAGYRVRVAADAAEALRLADAELPNAVLSDVRMPGQDGIALLQRMRAEWPDMDVVMMTAFDDMPTVISAMKHGAADFLVKPVDLAHLCTVLERVLADAAVRRRRSTAPAPAQPQGLIGSHPAMIDVFKQVGQAAVSSATVLVRGESGTGKELIAHEIHANSARSAEPFVAVNCAAVAATLLESELFGHARGAFTGAVAARRGCFAAAGSGTIFLDEIGDTTAEFQSKLLRVLQTREYQPVGAERVERTNARVIAATHQPLEALVAAGRFRADLYYRLRVLEILVPPLRERMSDVPRLAAHLAARAAAAAGLDRVIISPAALEALQRHDWPGNVRELENCIVRAVTRSGGHVIRPEHLGLARSVQEVEQMPGSLTDMEREHLVRVLSFTGGHKARAAEILGVSRPRLNRLLQKYGIE
jgi:DNA-binding NtrC family response regulator